MNQAEMRLILNRLWPKLEKAVSDAGLPCLGDWGIQEQFDGSGFVHLELSATLCRAGEPLLAPPPASYGRLRVRVTDDPWDTGPVVHLRLTTDDWCRSALVEAWDQEEISRALRKITAQCEKQWGCQANDSDEQWSKFLRGE